MSQRSRRRDNQHTVKLDLQDGYCRTTKLSNEHAGEQAEYV